MLYDLKQLYLVYLHTSKHVSKMCTTKKSLVGTAANLA